VIDDDEVRCAGRLFHRLAAKTSKARLPTPVTTYLELFSVIISTIIIIIIIIIRQGGLGIRKVLR